MVRPIVAARREQPQDDLISMLVQAELTDDDGATTRLTDREIDSFVLLLLGAGSGTTWKQMGTTITALLQRPELLEAVRVDRQLLRPAIEESLRWMPTDPMFSRWVTADTELGGVEVPAGSVVHLAIGAANRDPARWDRPDEFDITRKLRPSLGFGQGSHICLGMHVARAEMTVAISALLDRLPNLRLDPDAEPPRFVGMYERGATAIPVLFDPVRGLINMHRIRITAQTDLTLVGADHIRRVPGDRRRGRLPVERRADAAADRHRAPHRPRRRHVGV